MKRYPFLFLFIFIISFLSFGCNAQNSLSSQSTLNRRITDKDFLKFINSFSETICPYNSKKGYPRPYSIIPSKWVSKYLKIKNKDMYYLVSKYDQEEEKITSTARVLKDYTRCALLYTDDFILITYGCEYSDRIGENYYRYEYLTTLDYNGTFLDSICLIHGNWISNNKHEEYALIDPTQFILFKYSINTENIDKTTGIIIDEKQFHSICEIHTYHINKEGRIDKIKSDMKHLKFDHYLRFDPIKYPDDPMNKY